MEAAHKKFITDVLGIREILLPSVPTPAVSVEGPGEAPLAFLCGPLNREKRELLEKMILAMKVSQAQVNIIQAPENQKIELRGIFKNLRPRVVVVLGEKLFRQWTGEERSFGRLRGQWISHESVMIMPTWSLETLLTDASSKRVAWRDLQEVMKELG